LQFMAMSFPAERVWLVGDRLYVVFSGGTLSRLRVI